MNILFTGASSFTGLWFIQEMAKAGHKIFSTFRQTPETYRGMRRIRVEKAVELSTPCYACTFGDERFLALIKSKQHWDLFCHHAAEVHDYKSPFFDPIQALVSNTKNANTSLQLLKERGCKGMLLTGTVF